MSEETRERKIGKPPRSLRYNPQNYDIELSATVEEDGDSLLFMVRGQIADVKIDNCLVPAELEKIGKWFVACAKWAREEEKKAKVVK